MTLCHKWDVRNDFAYVLQFFSLISDGLGSVECEIRVSLSRAGYNGACMVHTYSGHKYMSVEGNYAAKIKLIIQNESNLSKLSPCAWPYI